MSPAPLSRRRFLQGAVATGTAMAFGPRVALASAAPPAGDTLVLIVLRGGLDGLSALVPLADGASYQDARRGVAVPEAAALPVARGFGLHPALAPLHELYQDGVVALVPALGGPDPSRSHFDQQRSLERGAPAAGTVTSGWLSRHLASRGSQPLQATSNGGRLPEVLRGSRSAIAVPSLDDVVVRLERTGDLATGGARLRELSGDGPLGAAAAASTAAATALLGVPPPHGAAAGYPQDAVADSLHDVARLLNGGIDLDAAVVDMGGWDLHAGMGDAARGPMRARLGVLASSLAAFHRETAALARPVTTVVVSEFGRRVAVNASGGTDHGRGGLLVALGAGVVGGVHGAWPGLAADVLDEGDVPVATDVREPLAELLWARLGNPDVAGVFPGFTPRPLGLARTP